MGGIAAIFHRDGRPVDDAAVQKVASALRPHGPDGVTTGVDGPLGYVHAKFVLTPEDREDHQPVEEGAGRFQIWFDGRLDNRDDLLQHFPAAQHLPDSVLIAKSWARWEAYAAARWAGPFAVIVFDRMSRQIVALRNPMGHRVLHYHLTDTRIAIASSPQAILALDGVAPDLDRQKIADALCRFTADAGRGYFRDIQRVCPGEVLTVTPDRTSTKRFYRLEDRVKEIRFKSDTDYVDAAREQLQRAVRAQLRSASPVSSLISGGLDSSTVAVTAAAQLDTLRTYTSVPDPDWDGQIRPGAYGDETPYIHAIARLQPRINPEFVPSEGLGLYHRLDDRLRTMGMPLRNAMNVYWLHDIMERTEQSGSRVLLDGSFGNFTFSYAGGDLLCALLRKGKVWQATREIFGASKGLRGSLRMLGGEVIVPFGPDWIWQWNENRRKRASGVDSLAASTAIMGDSITEFRMDDRIREARARYSGHPLGRMTTRQQIRRMMEASGAPELGDIVQGLMAQHRVELRDPFSDLPLIEWIMGVPEEQFRRGRQKKWLVKRVMTGSLPDSVLYKSIPSGAQTPDWHVRMFRDLDRIRADLDQMADQPDIASLIDVPKLQRLLDQWPADTLSAGRTGAMLSVVLPHALQVGRFMQLFRASP